MATSPFTDIQAVNMMEQKRWLLANWIKREHKLKLLCSITVLRLLATFHMSIPHALNKMNINDGLYESNASANTKIRALYLANLCFVNH